MARTPPERNTAPDNHSAEQVDEIVMNRASIEQAKGMLMFIYGIDPNHAFQLLRCQARSHNLKVRLLAEQLITDVSVLTPDQRLDMQSTCTNLLRTVHERVRPQVDDP